MIDFLGLCTLQEMDMQQDIMTPDDALVGRLVDEMNRKGFSSIPNLVAPDQLAVMQSFVTSQIEGAVKGYVGFTGVGAAADPAFKEFSETHMFRNVMRRLYEHGASKRAPDAPFYQVLRCLSGEASKAHSLIFHYDSYVVTALLPVVIPTDGQAGDLVMLPFRRKIRRSYLANLVDKLLLDNKLTQFILRTLWKVKLLPLIHVRMVPGNVYFFWGYQTVHANEPCDEDKIRATALFHFGNPHGQSSFRSVVRRLLPR